MRVGNMFAGQSPEDTAEALSICSPPDLSKESPDCQVSSKSAPQQCLIGLKDFFLPFQCNVSVKVKISVAVVHSSVTYQLPECLRAYVSYRRGDNSMTNGPFIRGVRWSGRRRFA